MSLIQRISRGALDLRADMGGSPAPWDDYWYNSVGQASASGMRVDPEQAKRLSTVVACVTARGRALATMPCKIFTDIAGGGKRVVTNHPLYDVLYTQANDLQTAFDFKMMMQAHVDLRGNAYAEKVPGPRGPCDQLVPMHPDRVKVEVLRGSGRLRYVYNDPLTNETRALMQDEVFHLRDWSDNAAVGQSRISMGLDVIGTALARQDYMARFLKNDARAGMAITGTAFKTLEDENKYRDNFQAAQTGKNRGKLILLPPGADIKSMGVTPVDAQLLEGHKASQVEICTLMGILPHLVGVDAGKSATYASVEQFNIMHAQQTVHPMIVMWEQAIQRDLIVSSYYYAKFSMAALLRGDNATRFAGYAVAIQNSWMCPDDVRELEDLNPIPNGEGKVFWRSANLLPLKQLTAPESGKARPNNNQAEQDDAPEDGAGGDASARAAKIGRLQLLAAGSADRCVRKEVAAVRKLIARDGGAYEVTEFYVEHARFIAEVFHMDTLAALNVKIACDARAQQLTMLLADEEDEFHAAAQVWIENVAATEPGKLVSLAVEGVK